MSDIKTLREAADDKHAQDAAQPPAYWVAKISAKLSNICATLSEAKKEADKDVPADHPVTRASAIITGAFIHIGSIRHALEWLEKSFPETTSAKAPPMTDRKLLEDVRDALKPFADVDLSRLDPQDSTFALTQFPGEDPDRFPISAYIGWSDLVRATTTLARVEAALAETEDEAIGWLFINPDAGIEFNENHPIESGECEDAEDIRPATASALKDELLDAWKRLDECGAELSARVALAETEEEKVERVARAICKATFYDIEPDMYESEEAFFTKDGPDAWKHFGDSDFMHQARAAIAAMGE